MPTINYTLKLVCTNCGWPQEHNIPKGSMFISWKQGWKLEYRESGYHKNYDKADRKTIKRCVNCRAAALVRESEYEKL